MQKFFVINFESGFDLTYDLDRVKYVIEKFPNIEIFQIDESWQAYRYACFRHTRKKLSRNPFSMPIMPKFEDVLRAPFYERIVPVRTPRFFALIAEGYHASISTDITVVVNFLTMFDCPCVKEFNTYDASLCWVNKIFLTPIISMGAYIKEAIPLIDELDDSVSSFPYESWLDQNCELPPDKRFTPENCVVVPEKKEFTLPLDLIELPSPK